MRENKLHRSPRLDCLHRECSPLCKAHRSDCKVPASCDASKFHCPLDCSYVLPVCTLHRSRPCVPSQRELLVDASGKCARDEHARAKSPLRPLFPRRKTYRDDRERPPLGDETNRLLFACRLKVSDPSVFNKHKPRTPTCAEAALQRASEDALHHPTRPSALRLHLSPRRKPGSELGVNPSLRNAPQLLLPALFCNRLFLSRDDARAPRSPAKPKRAQRHA